VRPVIIDTDILSALMRREPSVVETSGKYITHFGKFNISVITRYEILRGLKFKDVKKQIHIFDFFCEMNNIIQITDEIIVKAADIYADLKRDGLLIPDADIIIASSAIVNDMSVSTNNQVHFGRIKGLHLQNWLNKS
jgi:tRNA(fMet)-specific endonuclease VapC